MKNETLWSRIEKKLARVTSSGDWIPEIDGLRFLAILLVVIMHAGSFALSARLHQPMPDLKELGKSDSIIRIMDTFWLGVPLFFVISGFVLGRPFASYWLGQTAKPPSLGDYYVRRVTRIEPPYLIALTGSYLFFSWAWAPLSSYGWSLFYVHTWVKREPSLVNGNYWSLEVEAVFYLIAPLLARILYQIRPAWLRSAILLLAIFVQGYVIRPYIWTHYLFLDLTFLAQVHFFLAGLLLADWHVSGLVPRRQSYLWDLVAIAGAALIFYSPLTQTLYWTSPLAILVFYCGTFQGRVVNRLFRLRVLTLIGGMCYTIYLWHTPFSHWLRASILPRLVARFSTNGAAVVAACLVCVPMILLASALVFYWTEKPFMNGPGSRRLAAWIRRPFRKSEQAFSFSLR